MAGKVYFRQGALHVSRLDNCFKNDADLRPSLEELIGKSIPYAAFNEILIAVAIARKENAIQTRERPTRKDAVAQLKAMLRLSGDELLHALRGCDRLTFEAIRQAQIDAISEVLCSDGLFIDVRGDEYRMPPSIYLGLLRDGREVVPPYLPMGVSGVHAAIALALKRIEDGDTIEDGRTRFHPKTGPGNAKKDYQLDLARACLDLWKSCDPRCGQRAWRTTGTGKRSKLVSLSAEVFRAAGLPVLSASRLVALLKKAK